MQTTIIIILGIINIYLCINILIKNKQLRDTMLVLKFLQEIIENPKIKVVKINDN